MRVVHHKEAETSDHVRPGEREKHRGCREDPDKSLPLQPIGKQQKVKHVELPRKDGDDPRHDSQAWGPAGPRPNEE